MTKANRGRNLSIMREAADSMAGALQSVAILNHIPRHKFTWRHGSIASRQRAIESLVGRQVDALPIDRASRRIKLAALAALALFATLATVDTIYSLSPEIPNPAIHPTLARHLSPLHHPPATYDRPASSPILCLFLPAPALSASVLPSRDSLHQISRTLERLSASGRPRRAVLRRVKTLPSLAPLRPPHRRRRRRPHRRRARHRPPRRRPLILLNADGSPGGMSGNGARCIAKLAGERGYTHAVKRDAVRIETDHTIVRVEVHRDRSRRIDSSTVDMGEPILEAVRIPVAIPRFTRARTLLDVPLAPHIAWDPARRRGCRSAASIRAVLRLDGQSPTSCLFSEHIGAAPVADLGPFLERQSIFPERINVQFAEIVDRSTVRLRTWERGVGITLACGTGSCATVVAAALTGRLDCSATVKMLGGDLKVRWDESTNHVHLTGPAVEVYTATWNS